MATLKRQELWVLIAIMVAGFVTIGAGQYAVYVMTLAAIYAIAAVGLDVLIGQSGYISVAQSAFFGIGAYTVAIGSQRSGLNSWWLLLLAAIVAAAASVLIGLLTLRTEGLYFAIATLGVTFAVVGLFYGLSDLTNGIDGIPVPGPDPVPVIGYQLVTPDSELWFALAALALVYLMASWFARSNLGAACRAVREDVLLARAVGIRVGRTRLYAFAFSAGSAGLAGGIFASFLNFISPENFHVMLVSLSTLVMVVLGGRSSLWGPMLGAAIVVGLPEAFRVAPHYAVLAYGLMVLAVVIYFPKGVAGFVFAVGAAVRRGGAVTRREPTAVPSAPAVDPEVAREY